MILSNYIQLLLRLPQDMEVVVEDGDGTYWEVPDPVVQKVPTGVRDISPGHSEIIYEDRVVL